MSSGSVFHGVWTMNDGTVLNNSGMLMRLDFDEETHVVSGSGSDSIGVFQITGLFLESKIRFTKTYVGSNSNVSWMYAGERVVGPDEKARDGDEREYVGHWGSTRGSIRGRFAMSSAKNSRGSKERVEVSTWEGIYSYFGQPKRKDPAMACCIAITTPIEPVGMPEGIKGIGIDAHGSFTLDGEIESSGKFVMIKKYRSYEWRYVGTFDRQSQTLAGHWGRDDGSVGGAFVLKRSPSPVTAAHPGLRPLGK